MALLDFGYCLCCLSDFSESTPQSCFTNYCETCLWESSEWEINAEALAPPVRVVVTNPPACDAHVEAFFFHHGRDICGSDDIPF